MARLRGRSVQSEAKSRQLNRDDWCALADKWIFSERNRFIFVRHVLDGVKYEQLNNELIAKGEYPLSDRQLAGIISKSMDIITAHI